MSIFGGDTSGSQGALLSSLLRQAGMQNALNVMSPQYIEALKTLQGKNYYDPYSKAGGLGLGMLQNALGLKGAAGNAAAQNAFQTGPGYQFALSQGLQGVDRGASAKGLLGSGNAAMALNDYAQGMANQEYGNWLSRLGGLSQMGLSAAAGQTGRQNSIANLQYGYGRDQANLISGTANSNADAMNRGYEQDAMSRAQGQANLFGGIGGLLNLGLGGYRAFQGL